MKASKERMRRLMDTIAGGRLDTSPLVKQRFALDQVEKADELFANQRDGALKAAITARRCGVQEGVPDIEVNADPPRVPVGGVETPPYPHL